MSRAATAHNGQLPAVAPVRVMLIGVRGLSLAMAVQLLVLVFAGTQYIDGIRADQRADHREVIARLDSFDRRLSKLDGVPR